MTKKRDRKERSNGLPASIVRELANPRMARSARIAELNQNTTRAPVPPSMTMPGTVDKIISPSHLGQPEKVQVGIDGADPGYRDLRIENILIDEHGDDVTLEIGSPVEVTVTAHHKI